MLPKILIDKSQDLTSPLVISLVGAGGKTSSAFWLAQNYKKLGHQVLITTTTKMYYPFPTQADNFISLQELNKQSKSIKIHSSSQIANIRPDNCHSNDLKQGAITFLYTHKIPNEPRDKVQGITAQEVNELKKNAAFTILIVEADGAICLPIKCPAAHEPNMPNCTDIVICVTSAENIFMPINKQKINRWQEFTRVTKAKNQQILGKEILSNLLNHKNGSFKAAPENSTKIWLINKIDLNNKPTQLVEMAKDIIKQQVHIEQIWLANMQTNKPIKHIVKSNKDRQINDHYHSIVSTVKH